jgi:hypothetical protein
MYPAPRRVLSPPTPIHQGANYWYLRSRRVTGVPLQPSSLLPSQEDRSNYRFVSAKLATTLNPSPGHTTPSIPLPGVHPHTFPRRELSAPLKLPTLWGINNPSFSPTRGSLMTAPFISS